MKRADLKAIVADVLEIEPSELESDTVLDDFDTYDSVNILMLMVALDEQAGIKLSPNDTSKLNTFGDLEALAVSQGIALSD